MRDLEFCGHGLGASKAFLREDGLRPTCVCSGSILRTFRAFLASQTTGPPRAMTPPLLTASAPDSQSPRPRGEVTRRRFSAPTMERRPRGFRRRGLTLGRAEVTVWGRPSDVYGQQEPWRRHQGQCGFLSGSRKYSQKSFSLFHIN